MSTSRPVLLALAALGLGLAPLSTQAAPPPRPSQVQADDDQQQEAYLGRAVDDEEAFRGQRARLLRLHALAWEDNDTKRVTELERLLKRAYSMHLRKMNEHRKHLKGAWRDRLEERVVERREHAEKRHDARDERRDERHDARSNQRTERRGERNTVRADGQAERRDVRDAHRAHRHEGQAPVRTGTAPKREPAAPRQVHPNGDRMRMDGAAADRRPVGHATHLAQGKDGPRHDASLGQKRPVPPARRAPGSGGDVSMSRAVTDAAPGAGPRNTAGRVPSRRLSSRREAETRAAASISRKNAEAEYQRLLKELESEQD